jgi:hypothetical protein
MALCTSIICDTCHRKKDVWYSPRDVRPPATCSGCLEARAAEEKRACLETLAKLPIEERLKKIEEFIYDHERAYHASKPLVF